MNDRLQLPAAVEITEVGLRDGIQNEPVFIPTQEKIRLLDALIDAGVRHFEATSFVSPRAVPQLKDAADVLAVGASPSGQASVSTAASRCASACRASAES